MQNQEYGLSQAASVVCSLGLGLLLTLRVISRCRGNENNTDFYIGIPYTLNLLFPLYIPHCPTSALIISHWVSIQNSTSYLLLRGWECMIFGKAELTLSLSDQSSLMTSHCFCLNKEQESKVFSAIQGFTFLFLPPLRYFLTTHSALFLIHWITHLSLSF